MQPLDILSAPLKALTLLTVFLVSLGLYIKHNYSTKAERRHAAARSSSTAFIIQTRVSHARLLPKEASHGFTYPALYFLVSLNALEAHLLDRGGGWLFGYGGVFLRVTGMRPSAYLQADNCALLTIKEKLRKLLKERGYDHDESALEDAWMLTMPSYLGLEGINPLSVYFCYRRDANTPWAIVLEIHNTFGERHAHILRVGVMEDEKPAEGFEHQWKFPREFHVSPFNDRAGSYVVSVTVPRCSPSRLPDWSSESCLGPPLHPKVRVHVLTSESIPSSLSPQVKLTAIVCPTSIIPLTSMNLLISLIQHPFILFLSLPRILFHAWILHYRKKLPIYPRPEPHATVLHANGDNDASSGGIGWQSQSWLHQLARAYIHQFLAERTKNVGTSVTLVSGNPYIPRTHFSCAGAPLTDSEDALTITYLSDAFFALLLEAPSARHALLYGKATKLFTPSSEDLFLHVFSTLQQTGGTVVPRALSIAQRCRLLLLPGHLRGHPGLPVPHQHPTDSCTSSLGYIGIIVCLLLSCWNRALEGKLYNIFRVRFVSGQEPWRQWDQVKHRRASD